MMSSALVSRSVPLPSPIKLTEEEASRINIEKQGIVTILGKDLEITKVPPSLRRTLSADMSSKNFLSQNRLFSPMKRIIASSEDLNNMPSHEDIWRSIQKEDVIIINSKQVNTDWSSILNEKVNNEATNLPPPYVHPLVKKPSTLNEKSLEICTESLGSETGSDNFSSEKSDAEDDKEEQATPQVLELKQQENESQMQNSSFEDVKVAKYNYDPTKKMTTPKSFPPPLPSLARKDGPSVQMQSHRTDGRLVLEAVSVPQKTYFQTDRKQGRLVLTLVNSPDAQDSSQEAMNDDKVANFEEVFDSFGEFEGAHEAKTDEDDYEDEDEEEDEEQEAEEEDEEQEAGNGMAFFSSSSLPISGILNVHKSALMMKSLMGLGNRDPTWTNKLNKAVELMEGQVVAELAPPLIPQSLPPQPRVARLIPTSSTPPPPPPTPTSLNAYEYFWRNKKTTYVDQEGNNLKGNNINKVVQPNINHGIASNEKQENMVLVKGNNGDYLVPFIQGCKENRRSLLYRQPHCIATS